MSILFSLMLCGNRSDLGDNPVVDKDAGQRPGRLEYEPFSIPMIRRRERRRFTSGERHLKVQKPSKNLVYRVIATDFVTMEDGTGIVHVAPAYGEDGLSGRAGKRTGFRPDGGFAGQDNRQLSVRRQVRQSRRPAGTGRLESTRAAFSKSGTVQHTYPFCWRCNSPLLYYAKQTWYIRTTAVKDATDLTAMKKSTGTRSISKQAVSVTGWKIMWTGHFPASDTGARRYRSGSVKSAALTNVSAVWTELKKQARYAAD